MSVARQERSEQKKVKRASTRGQSPARLIGNTTHTLNHMRIRSVEVIFGLLSQPLSAQPQITALLRDRYHALSHGNTSIKVRLGIVEVVVALPRRWGILGLSPEGQRIHGDGMSRKFRVSGRIGSRELRQNYVQTTAATVVDAVAAQLGGTSLVNPRCRRSRCLHIIQL